jgi:hypothetical protein
MIEHRSVPIVTPAFQAVASIEFFAIQLAPTSDGRFFVGIEATVCDGECDLSQMELGHHRAASLDDALDVIRHAISTAH